MTTVDQPGTYEFAAWYIKGQGPEIVLAIGQGFTGKLMRTIGGGIAILFGSGAVGIGIAVVTFRKRRRAI